MADGQSPSLLPDVPAVSNECRQPAPADSKRKSSREKIEKLVADGAKNYPAYLKLIYTGESELSSEDEIPANKGSERRVARVRAVAAPRSKRSGDVKVTSVARSTDKYLSPESDKLLDPGKEKLPTPTGEKNTESMSTGKDIDLNAAESCSNSEFSVVDVENSGDISWNNSTAAIMSPTDEDETVQMKLELFKLQDDIATLRGQLDAKLQVAADLKRRLGITAFGEFKHSVRHLRQTETYQRTNAAFKSFGVYATKKMENFRRSRTTTKAKPGTVTQGSLLTCSKSETNVANW